MTVSRLAYNKARVARFAVKVGRRQDLRETLGARAATAIASGRSCSRVSGTPQSATVHNLRTGPRHLRTSILPRGRESVDGLRPIHLAGSVAADKFSQTVLSLGWR